MAPAKGFHEDDTLGAIASAMPIIADCYGRLFLCLALSATGPPPHRAELSLTSASRMAVVAMAAIQQLVPRRVQFHGEIRGPADVGMHAFHQVVIGGMDFVFSRSRANSEDFERPIGVHVAGHDIAPTILFFRLRFAVPLRRLSLATPFRVLPLVENALGRLPLSFVSVARRLQALSLGGFPLSLPVGFVFRPVAPFVGAAAKQAREYSRFELRLRSRKSVVRGQLEQAIGLARVLRQPATALLAKAAEMVLRNRDSLIGGELEQACGLAIVSRRAAAAKFIEDPEIALGGCVALIGGELEQERGLVVILRQPASALRVFRSEAALRGGEPLLGGELEQTNGLALVLRQSATALLEQKPKIVLCPGVAADDVEHVAARVFVLL
jgi:hypothetical protein